MSMSHHGSPEEQAAANRLLDQFLNRATPSFPEGKLHKTDEGELAFAIAHDSKTQTVILKFGKPVEWFGVNKQQALQLANAIISHAAELK